MKTFELSPADAYLVAAASERTPKEFAFELGTYDGKYAVGILQDALENIDPAISQSKKARLIQARIFELKKEAQCAA